MRIKLIDANELNCDGQAWARPGLTFPGVHANNAIVKLMGIGCSKDASLISFSNKETSNGVVFKGDMLFSSEHSGDMPQVVYDYLYAKDTGVVGDKSECIIDELDLCDAIATTDTIKFGKAGDVVAGAAAHIRERAPESPGGEAQTATHGNQGQLSSGQNVTLAAWPDESGLHLEVDRRSESIDEYSAEAHR